MFRPIYLSFFIIFMIVNISAQDSLNLNQAISNALAFNYDIRIQSFDQKSASIQNNWGEAGAYPTIDFSLAGTRQEDIDSPNSLPQDLITGDITARWIIFDGFAIFITKSKLDQLEEQSAGHTALLIEQTVQSVILTYFRALLFTEEVQVLDTLRMLSRDRYDKVMAHRKLGVSATYDVLQAKTAWLEDEARFLGEFALSKNAIRHLNYLMGKTGDCQSILTEPFTYTSKSYDISVLQRKMLKDNTLLKNRYIQQKLLDKELTLAKLQWLPSITLRAGIEGSTSNVNRFSQILDNKSAYGTATLTWNLFSGGARLRAVQLAKLDQDIGDIEILAMQHRLMNQLLMQMELYDVRSKLLNVANEALSTTQLNLKISTEKYKAGAINSFNYRDVQLQYLNSALTRLRAIYKLIETETDLMRLTGGILSSYVDER